jgi:hypothetical protein
VASQKDGEQERTLRGGRVVESNALAAAGMMTGGPAGPTAAIAESNVTSASDNRCRTPAGRSQSGKIKTRLPRSALASFSGRQKISAVNDMFPSQPRGCDTDASLRVPASAALRETLR